MSGVSAGKVTRFLYVTDTHWGAQPGKGYTVQPRDPALFDRLHEGLKQWLLVQDPPVDFVLHGGDVVNDGSDLQITSAIQRLRELGLPTLVCLGNHDLEQKTSMAQWRQKHQGVLGHESGSYTVTFPTFHLQVLAHHWYSDQPPHFWDSTLPQSPVLDEGQRDNLEAFLAKADRPVVLAVHGPVQGVPPSQSGLEHELHKPDAVWRAYMLMLIERFPALRLILTAHAHVNTLQKHQGCIITGTASFTETPFEARLVTVTDHAFELQTLSFAPLLNINAPYLPDKAYAQGAQAQRTAKWTLS